MFSSSPSGQCWWQGSRAPKKSRKNTPAAHRLRLVQVSWFGHCCWLQRVSVQVSQPQIVFRLWLLGRFVRFLLQLGRRYLFKAVPAGKAIGSSSYSHVKYYSPSRRRSSTPFCRTAQLTFAGQSAAPLDRGTKALASARFGLQPVPYPSRLEAECQRQAVRMMSSSEERGSQPRTSRAFSLLATRVGESPSRRSTWSTGKLRPETFSIV